MLPSTNVVPVGIASFIVAVPATSPVFVTVIVYVNTSSFSAVSALTVFVASITGFFVVGVSSSFTFAVFMIEPSVPSFTVTLKLIVSVPPLASTDTAIPAFKSFSASVVATPLTLILPVTNVVPAGIVSFTTASPATLPLFVTVIVYSISSPTTTADLFEVFSLSIIGLYTVTSDGFVGVSPTKAMFSITLLSPSNSFIVTSNVSSFVSPGFISTLFQIIVLFSILIFSAPKALPSTSVVPSGTTSLTVVLAISSPLFVT